MSDNYYVVNWDTDEIIKDFGNDLDSAKKFCRSLGHTGIVYPMFHNYPPIAYVGVYRDIDGKPVMCCKYNPRFKIAP